MLICDFVFSSTVTPKTRSDDTSYTFFGAAVRGYSLASPARLDSLTFGWTIGVEKPLNLHLCALTDKWGTKKEKKTQVEAEASAVRQTVFASVDSKRAQGAFD